MNKLFLPFLTVSVLIHTIILVSIPAIHQTDSMASQKKIMTVRRVTLTTSPITGTSERNNPVRETGIPPDTDNVTPVDPQQSVLEMLAGWEDAPVADTYASQEQTWTGTSENLNRSALSQPAPPYPEQARRNGWEGICTLEIEIAGNGSITGIKIVGSSGYSVLDNACVNTVKNHWHFGSLESGGVIRRQFEFRLTDPTGD